MTKEEIINGLKMSMDLTLFDPSTGEVMEPWQLNDINRTAYEAYKGAIELLEKQPDTTTHDSIPAETGKNYGDRTSGDCISRQMAIDALKEKVFHNLSDEFYGAMQVLDELPSVQPETAKRIVGKSRSGMTLWYQCDTCNEPVDAQDNYCRGCGRRLIDEATSERLTNRKESRNEHG